MNNILKMVEELNRQIDESIARIDENQKAREEIVNKLVKKGN